MATQDDSIAVILAACHYSYQLFHRIFGSEPDDAMLDVFADKYTFSVLGMVFNENDENLQILLNAFEDITSKRLADHDSLLDSLLSEYTHLLVGPSKLPAPPWESVFATDERMLFQSCTFDVRRLYKQHGYVPSNYPHEADDHLALELDFMAHLAASAFSYYEQGDMENAKKSLLSQQHFLNKHLLVWIDSFANAIQTAMPCLLYPQAALAVARFLKNYADIILELDNAWQ